MLAKLWSLNSVLFSLLILLVACAPEPQQRIATPNEVLSDDLPRAALVIGNSQYRSVSALANPRNDAIAVASALSGVGYSVYAGSAQIDLTRDEMQAAVDAFAKDISSSGGIAFIYYAGHGIQVDGQNYLIPIDAEIKNQADIKTQTVDLQSLLNAVSATNVEMKVVVIDACRDNPFEAATSSSEETALTDISVSNSGEGLRSISSGLSQVTAPPGSLIAFATAPGTAALDGDGQNSPYAEALVNILGEQGLRVEDVFIAVRNRVRAATAGQQVPWETSSLTSVAMFTGAATVKQNSKLPTSAWDGKYFAELRCTGGKGHWTADRVYHYSTNFSRGLASTSIRTRLRDEQLDWIVRQDGTLSIRGTVGRQGSEKFSVSGPMANGNARLVGGAGANCSVKLWRQGSPSSPLFGMQKLTGEMIGTALVDATGYSSDRFEYYSDSTVEVTTVSPDETTAPDRFTERWSQQNDQYCTDGPSGAPPDCNDVFVDLTKASPDGSLRAAIINPATGAARLTKLRRGRLF